MAAGADQKVKKCNLNQIWNNKNTNENVQNQLNAIYEKIIIEILPKILINTTENAKSKDIQIVLLAGKVLLKQLQNCILRTTLVWSFYYFFCLSAFFVFTVCAEFDVTFMNFSNIHTIKT